MSTRAMYSFTDANDPPETHHVYKHHDGYPTGAAKALAKAAALAWPAPRFEADEYAASFIAANKDSPGGLRTMLSGAFTDVAPGDIEFYYTVTAPAGALKHPQVEAFTVDDVGTPAGSARIFKGNLPAFIAWTASTKNKHG